MSQGLSADTAPDASELARFRAETRAWLEANCPPGARGAGQTAWGSRRIALEPDVRLWLERMADRGWTVPTWPRQFGGAELTRDEYTVLIDEMKRIDAPRMAREKGEHLARRLSAVEGVVDVRGQGLLRAADLGSGRDAKAVYGALLERGLVTNAVNATSLRLAPPITTPVEQIDEAVSIIASVLAEGVGA